MQPHTHVCQHTTKEKNAETNQHLKNGQKKLCTVSSANMHVLLMRNGYNAHDL
jgi:prophage antirepressor-like protein